MSESFIADCGHEIPSLSSRVCTLKEAAKQVIERARA